MKYKIIKSVLSVTALLISNFAFSQAGTLDMTFGFGGKVENNFGENNQANGSILQPDGKIVVVGNTYSFAPGSSFLVTRYLTNGVLDLTFGGTGYVTNLVGDHCSAQCVSLQTDGKIVVAGNTYIPQANSVTNDIMIVRYNQDGTLDTTFGNAGMTIVSIPNSQSVNAMLIQSNGNIIVGGSFSLPLNSENTFALARFTPNGNLDTTFGIGGFVSTPNIVRGEILDMKFIDNEDIIAVGRRQIIQNYLMVRYNSNGQVVNSFGPNNNGTVQVAYNNEAYLKKCVISDNNEIYASGATYNDVKFNAFITKYNSNGIIDATFGVNGIKLRDFGNTENGISKSSFAVDICFDNSHNLLVGYSVGAINDYDFGLESYNSSGNLNTTFGTNGYFTTTFGIGHEYFKNMLVQPDNKIVMVGDKGLQVLARVNNSALLSTGDFIPANNVAKFNPNPFTDFDSLSLTINKSGTLNVALYDLKGMLLSNLITDKNVTEDVNFETLNFSNISLPKGMYFLKVTLDNQLFDVIKIVKN